VQSTIDPIFADLPNGITAVTSRLDLEVGAELDVLIEDLQASTPGHQNEAFRVNLEHRKPQMLRAVASLDIQMKRFFRKLKGAATNDGNGDLFRGAMEEIYEEASCLEASGRQSRRHVSFEFFRENVCNPSGPYPDIPNGIERRWKDKKARFVKSAMQSICTPLNEMQRSYERLCVQASVEKDDATLKARSNVLAIAKEARKELNGPNKDLLRGSGLEVDVESEI
jgi:hypothetical protein